MIAHVDSLTHRPSPLFTMTPKLNRQAFVEAIHGPVEGQYGAAGHDQFHSQVDFMSPIRPMTFGPAFALQCRIPDFDQNLTRHCGH